MSGIGNSLWLVFTPARCVHQFLPKCNYVPIDQIRGGLLVAAAAPGSPNSADSARVAAHDLVAHQRDVLVARAHRRRRGADRADHGAGLIADRGADADHARQKFLAVERIAVAAHNAQRFDQRRKFGDGLVGEALHAVARGCGASRLPAARPRWPCRARWRAALRPCRLLPVSTRTAWRASRTASVTTASPCRAARCTVSPVALVDGFQIGLRAARQIDLQAGVAEIENAGAERIKPAARHLRGKAALDQRRQQMVAGGDVEAGARGELGQRRLAAGLGDGFQQVESAVNGLDAVAVAAGACARRGRALAPGPGKTVASIVVSPWAPREIAAEDRVKEFSGLRSRFSQGENQYKGR